jgi:phosphatidylglycerophosphatase A
LLGVAWFALLLCTGSLWLFLAGAVASLPLSVWLCGEAEKILGKTDPGCVVLDEIVAIPFCFLPWVVSQWVAREHAMPPVGAFFAGHAWLGVIGVFALFRLFDIWKPWPIRKLQDLPGGWGVTADDILAAGYVALVTSFFVK